MTNLPKITIITVVKNSVKTIEKAIQSVLAQSYPNLEYIILDGKSTDGTLDIIKKYESQISFWRSEEDGGAAYAYNEAIGIANGEIIGYLNADDFYEDGVLLKVGELFKKNQDLDIISFKFRVLEIIDGKYVEESESTIAEIELEKDKDCPCLGINAKFFKKDLFLKYGLPLCGIKENQQFLSNDTELLIRLMLNGAKNLAVDEVGYNYLMSDESQSFAGSYADNPIYMEDKVLIAQKFLGEEYRDLLNEIWKKKFKKWIKKYRAKLIISQLKHGNLSEAKRHFFSGFKENNPITLFFYVLKTFIRN